MWLALRLCRRAGIADLIECRKKVAGATPFIGLSLTRLLKECAHLGYFSCIITAARCDHQQRCRCRGLGARRHCAAIGHGHQTEMPPDPPTTQRSHARSRIGQARGAQKRWAVPPRAEQLTRSAPIRECSPGLCSHQRAQLRSQSLPFGHPADQPEDLQRTACGERLTRSQTSLALPRPASMASNAGPKPPLNTANAAQSGLQSTLLAASAHPPPSLSAAHQQRGSRSARFARRPSRPTKLFRF